MRNEETIRDMVGDYRATTNLSPVQKWFWLDKVRVILNNSKLHNMNVPFQYITCFGFIEVICIWSHNRISCDNQKQIPLFNICESKFTKSMVLFDGNRTMKLVFIPFTSISLFLSDEKNLLKCICNMRILHS